MSEVPNPEHMLILDAIRDQFVVYKVSHPGFIRAIASGGECNILLEGFQSERHPDLAAYQTPLPAQDRTVWDLWVPELVIEVVPPGSEDRDYRETREEYLAFGIKEYWIVDPAKQSLLILRRDRGRWVEHRVGPIDSCETPLLPGFRFECRPVFQAAGN